MGQRIRLFLALEAITFGLASLSHLGVVMNKAIVFLDRLMPRPMQRTVFGKVTAG